MAKDKIIYVCSDCGAETPNWAGKCPSCGAWNTLREMKLTSGRSKTKANIIENTDSRPKKIGELSSGREIRFSTGIPELDRVLGGGAVIGSLILVGGAPGIGKSTLMLQMCGTAVTESRILYITGEESERQIKLRADRLRVVSEYLYVFAETDLDQMIKAIETIEPDIVIMGSS